MKRIALISLFLACMTAVSAAQGPGFMGPGGPGPGPHGMGGPPGMHGRWWKNSDVVKELQLTDAQIKQIEQTFLDYRLKLIDLHADVERQEAKLQPLLEADQPNEQQVGSQVDAVIAARGKLEKTNTLMMLAIRRVLTVDQWKKLQAMHQKQAVFIRHGHGMPPDDGNMFYFRRAPMGPPSPPDAPAPNPPSPRGESK